MLLRSAWVRVAGVLLLSGLMWAVLAWVMGEG